MITRWASCGAAIVLAVGLFVAPRLAIAQGTGKNEGEMWGEGKKARRPSATE